MFVWIVYLVWHLVFLGVCLWVLLAMFGCFCVLIVLVITFRFSLLYVW